MARVVVDRCRRQHAAVAGPGRRAHGRAVERPRPRRTRPAAAAPGPRDRQDRRHAAAVRAGGRCAGLCPRLPCRAGAPAAPAAGAGRAACGHGAVAREQPGRCHAGCQATGSRRAGQADHGAHHGAGPRRPDLAQRPGLPGAGRRAGGAAFEGHALARLLAPEGRGRPGRAVRGRCAALRHAARQRQGLPRGAPQRTLVAAPRVAQQPAAAGHVLSRPRSRTRRGQGRAAVGPPGHAAGHGRPGQNAAVAAGGGRVDGRLPRRRLVPGPVAAARAGAGGGRGGAPAAGAGAAGSHAVAGLVHGAAGPLPAAHRRQLRAPRRGRRRAGAGAVAGRPAAAPAHLEPRRAACQRRTDLCRSAAAGARPAARPDRPGWAGAAACGAAFCRACAGAPQRLRLRRRAGPRGGRAGDAARGHPAGPGAGGGAGALLVGGRHQHAPEGPLQIADRRQPRAAATPTDAARAGRLVLRPAGAGRADAAAAPGRVQRRL